MAKVTPEEFYDKYQRRLKGAVDDIRRGLEKVTEAPTAKAAAKQDKMKARIVEAIDSGKWARGLKRVSIEDWKTAAINKGVGRIAAGVDGASDKVKEFAAQLLSYQDSLKSKIEAMPDLTLEDRINRAVTWIREMSKFQKK